MPRILIVDSDETFSEPLLDLLGKEGFEVKRARDGAAALEALRDGDVDLALLDVGVSRPEPVDPMSQARQLSPRTLLVLIGPAPTVETAFAAIRHGVHDYFPKPVGAEEVANRIARLIERRQQAEEVQFLRRRVQGDFRTLLTIINESAAAPQGRDSRTLVESALHAHR